MFFSSCRAPVHSSVEGHLGCFQNMAIVNRAAKNRVVQVTLLYPSLHSFGYIPRSGIAGSYGRSSFSFLRQFHIVFCSGYTNLHSHQQCIRVSSTPLPLLHILASICYVLLMIAILIIVRWNLNVVLICIFCVAKNVEHFSRISWPFALLLFRTVCSV
jgi:hypothetical protein